jgi:glycosyltransferase involved in cell wall biosynthesis
MGLKRRIRSLLGRVLGVSRAAPAAAWKPPPPPARSSRPSVATRDWPKLSVIMPNYNHGCYLETALEAILNQSYRPAEVLVVDDGSTDNSREILERIARRDPLVRPIYQERNQGVVAAWEAGYRQAASEYLFSTSADDCVLPGLFERSMGMLAEHPQAALCCSYPVSFQDQADGTVRWSPNPTYWSDTARFFSPDDLAEVLHGGYIAGHTTVFRRAAFEAAGGLLPQLKWHCDWFVWLVMAFRHGLCYIPEPLAALRIRGDSYSAAGVRRWEEQEEVLLQLLRLLKSPEYRDVLPYFARTSVMSIYNADHQIVRAYMAHPEQWDAIALSLIQQPLWEWSQYQAQIHATRAQRQQEANRTGSP